MKQTDRQSLQLWDDYIKNLHRETPVPVETDGDKSRRIARLPAACPNVWSASRSPQAGRRRWNRNAGAGLIRPPWTART